MPQYSMYVDDFILLFNRYIIDRVYKSRKGEKDSYAIINHIILFNGFACIVLTHLQIGRCEDP